MKAGLRFTHPEEACLGGEVLHRKIIITVKALVMPNGLPTVSSLSSTLSVPVGINRGTSLLTSTGSETIRFTASTHSLVQSHPTLRWRDATVVTTRFDFAKNKEKETVRVTLRSLITRPAERHGVGPEGGQRTLYLVLPISGCC